MKPKFVSRQATAVVRQRQAIARERVAAHLRGLLQGLDPETRIETCRAGIRALAQLAMSDGGESRAAGVLCGALVEVSPAFRAEHRGMTAAEALFRQPEGDE